MSFTTMKGTGKALADGAGVAFKLKLKFKAEVDHDQGDGPVRGIYSSSIALAVVATPQGREVR